MKLFYEVIEEIKETKIFKLGSSEYGSDFSLNINEDLLYPTFSVSEVYAGETLVDEIAFDKDNQEFYVRESGTILTKSEVLQYVKRGLIGWVTDSDFSDLRDDEALRELTQLINQFRTPDNIEFVKLSEELLSIPETMRTSFLDSMIKMVEAESDEAINEIKNNFKEFSEGMNHHMDSLLSRLLDIAKEKQNKSGIMAKLARLFR
nr:hypothetical protein [Paenibacillus bovis]